MKKSTKWIIFIVLGILLAVVFSLVSYYTIFIFSSKKPTEQSADHKDFKPPAWIYIVSGVLGLVISFLIMLLIYKTFPNVERFMHMEGIENFSRMPISSPASPTPPESNLSPQVKEWVKELSRIVSSSPEGA